jgi:hypothetical protein
MRSILCLLTLATALPAAAWTEDGHARVSDAVLRSLPDELRLLPHAARARHASGQPDIHSLRVVPRLSDRERADHWLDLDLLPEGSLPAERRAYEAWLRASDRGADKVGAVLYRVQEETERLTILFAELRRSPKSEILRSAAAAQIGRLSHYTSDLVQPLHTTKDFDGRDGARTGIHLEVDGWLGRLPPLARQPSAAPLRDLRAATLARLREAHRLLDALYAVHEQAPKKGPLTGPARDFAQRRAATAVRFSACVVLTAWRDSETLELPAWVPPPGD